MARWADNFDNRGKGSHKDFDEYFQKERDWLANYSMIMKETSDLFNQRIYAKVSK